MHDISFDQRGLQALSLPQARIPRRLAAGLRLRWLRLRRLRLRRLYLRRLRHLEQMGWSQTPTWQCFQEALPAISCLCSAR